MKTEDKTIQGDSLRAHLNLRLIVVIPAIFILLSLGVGLLAMALTQLFLKVPIPSPRQLLFLHLWIVGSSLLAGLLGAFLAHGITKPVLKTIFEAQKMIGYVEANPSTINAANEVGALSALFDQAFVSFVELVQAREMLDSVNEGIMALDQGGRVAGMNLRAQEILEVSLPEARHKALHDFINSSPANVMLLAIARNVLADQEERFHNRVPFCPPSGKETLLSLKVSPLKLKSDPEKLLGAVVAFREQPDRSGELPEIIGRSPRLAEVLDLVAKVAPTHSRVLILGESGTGKELIANAVHQLSPRREKSFIKINCAAIPETLLESELFGHEKGAFTGAIARKPGKFELANGGTIFLDEIGDMSPSTQAKVLRVLQEGEFVPVGGNETKKVDVRIIAATNKDLLAEVEQGRFREDLFYRLNVITLSLPPLRDRKLDIPFLADYFLEETARKSSHERKSLSRAAMDCLLAYSWPGNVRELENSIERASLLSSGSIIQPQDLPISQTSSPLPNSSLLPVEYYPRQAHASLNETLEAMEKELIIQALKKSGGVQVEAAKLLGLNHKNLWHKIKKHNIDLNGLRNSA